MGTTAGCWARLSHDTEPRHRISPGLHLGCSPAVGCRGVIGDTGDISAAAASGRMADRTGRCPLDRLSSIFYGQYAHPARRRAADVFYVLIVSGLLPLSPGGALGLACTVGTDRSAGNSQQDTRGHFGPDPSYHRVDLRTAPLARYIGGTFRRSCSICRAARCSACAAVAALGSGTGDLGCSGNCRLLRFLAFYVGEPWPCSELDYPKRPPRDKHITSIQWCVLGAYQV